MAEPPFDLAQAHRWFAVDLNNRAWDLVEAKSRTAEEAEEMLHAAHAACYHWRQIGAPINHLRALCLLATAYNVCGDYASALRFARNCCALSEQNPEQQTPFDRATAYGCLARALAGSGQNDEARRCTQLAREAAAQLEDPADREVFERLLAQ
jgi:tetratricopeptide (TPR) repeat protein